MEKRANEVYEKYKHLDQLLTDKSWLPDTFQGYMLYDFWQTIKETAQKGEGEKDDRRLD